ncbi:hypothetical protein K501DRAFT_259354 [Backusella circina FSU 941]|nr:hypothetical protein K501DRAFT_259354 [Backusella circina FSU 941]
MGATDSKLVFRKSVFQLFEERNVPWDADDYWELFWTLPESVEDIYMLVGAEDIRRARDTARENIETLIDKLMDKMDYIIHDSIDNQHQLLNCCRVLTRILPFIFESEDYPDWENEFFTKECEGSSKQTRVEKLMSLTLDSLFLAGFTLPASLATAGSNITYYIWETGVGSKVPISSSRENDSNKTEVLRLLMVLLSKSMYTAPSQIVKTDDPWLRYLAGLSDKKTVLAFLCSLLNTCCKYNPMGWSVPCHSLLFIDPRGELMAICLRALLVVLDYTTTIPKQVNGIDENIFRYYLSKLHRAQDFQFLIDCIYRILSNPMQPMNSGMTSHPKSVKYHIEMMMLCWKMLELNKRFGKYLIETGRALDLTIVLLYHANENKLKSAQVSVVRISTVVLQILSSHSNYCEKLNLFFEGHSALPIDSRISHFKGTYADYLILSIFSLIVSSKGILSSLYPTMIKILTNLSPFVKNLSPVTSSKLLALFSSFSTPAYLLADETNHLLTKHLLDMFNNALQHQFFDNPHLVYAIIRNHRKFERLHEFSLKNALLEVEKAYLLKESASEETTTNNNDSMEVKKELSFQRPGAGQFTQRHSSLSSVHSISTLFPGVKNGFIPTEEWVNEWHSKLPLNVIAKLIQVLMPKIEEHYNIHTSASREEIIYLISTFTVELPTLVLITHPFQWTEAFLVWFRSILWGQAYITSVSNFGQWNNTNIKLFYIKDREARTIASA